MPTDQRRAELRAALLARRAEASQEQVQRKQLSPQERQELRRQLRQPEITR